MEKIMIFLQNYDNKRSYCSRDGWINGDCPFIGQSSVDSSKQMDGLSSENGYHPCFERLLRSELECPKTKLTRVFIRDITDVIQSKVRKNR